MEVMIDIETLGISPTAQIIQLGACSDADDTFLANIIPDTHADRFTVDASVLMWWKSNEHQASVFKSITEGGEQIEAVLNNFTDWIRAVNPTELWCKGAAFDFAILHHAYRVTGINMPWSYRQERCLRTLYAEYDPSAIAAAEAAYPNLNAHNGLEDARHQLAVMQYLRRKPHLLKANIEVANRLTAIAAQQAQEGT